MASVMYGTTIDPEDDMAFPEKEEIVREFLTSDEGEVLLLNSDYPRTEFVSPTRSNTVASVLTVVPLSGAWQGSITELCQTIAQHRSLSKAEIVSVEGFRQPGAIVHRYLILELRREGRKNIWLRLDRRAAPDATVVGMLWTLGKTPANDVAQLSASRERLLIGAPSESENLLVFESNPTLDDLRRFLEVISQELTQYKAWPENCWLFASLIEQYLAGENEGTFAIGKLRYPELAHAVRRKVSSRIRAIYHIPAPQTFSDILLAVSRVVLTMSSSRRSFFTTLLQSIIQTSTKSTQVIAKVLTKVAGMLARVHHTLKAPDSLAFTFVDALVLSSKYDELQASGQRAAATDCIKPLASRLDSLASDLNNSFIGSRVISLRRILYKMDPSTKYDLAESLYNYSQLSVDFQPSPPIMEVPSNRNAPSYRSGLKHPYYLRVLDALSSAEEAVILHRQLYAEDPDQYRIDFVQSLETYAQCLSSADREPESTAASEEAVALRRVLAEADPEEHELNLGYALHNFAASLSRASRIAQACAVGDEAIILRRALYEKDASLHREDLAFSLHNSSMDLSATDRYLEALAQCTEAVELRRTLYKNDPKEHRWSLSNSLHNLGDCLANVDRLSDACAILQEAVTIRSLLAKQDPQRYQEDLGDSWYSLAVKLSDEERAEESCDAFIESMAVFRHLFQLDPKQYREDLGNVLNDYATELSGLSRAEEATSAYNEAVSLRRQLHEQNPAEYGPSLADSLHGLAFHLDQCGLTNDALGPGEAAIELRRILYKEDPITYQSLLASSLLNHGSNLSTEDRDEEACALLEESTMLYRMLHKQHPDENKPDLCNALYFLGISLSATDRDIDACAAFEELVALRRSLYQADPGEYRENLAESLDRFSTTLIDTNRASEACFAAKEAVSLQRELYELDQKGYQKDLAEALKTYGIRLFNSGRAKEACSVDVEAIKLYRELDNTESNDYQSDLGGILLSYGEHLTNVQDETEPQTALKEAINIYRKLFTGDQEAYCEVLGDSLQAYGVSFREKDWGKPEVVAAYQEASDLRRQLANSFPDTLYYLDDLSTSLHTLGVSLCTVGLSDEACAAHNETIKICKELYSRDPEAYGQELGAAYEGYATTLCQATRYDEAMKITQRARSLKRPLGDIKMYPNLESRLKNLYDSLKKVLALTGQRRRVKEAKKLEITSNAPSTEKGWLH